MMKAANTGPIAFGKVEKFNNKDSGTTGGRGHKKAAGNDKKGNVSNIGDEDEEKEAASKNRLVIMSCKLHYKKKSVKLTKFGVADV